MAVVGEQQACGLAGRVKFRQAAAKATLAAAKETLQ